MDVREEGEISDEETSMVYKPMERPNASSLTYREPEPIHDYEDSDSSDEDNLPKRRRVSYIPPPKAESPMKTKAKNTRKPNKIWSNILQEEALIENICDIGIKKKIVNDRNVESYEYPGARCESSGEEEEKKPKTWNRHSKKGSQSKVNKGPRHLLDANFSPDASDSDVGCLLAECLFEKKAALIVRVVEVLGKETTHAVYKKTQEVEKEGGMLIMDGTRRRTSGGVFLSLLKSFPGISREDVSKIFENDIKLQTKQKRKRKAERERKSDYLEYYVSPTSPFVPDDSNLHLNTLFSSDPGGTKCPGSTPVTSPEGSDAEADITVQKPAPVVLDEVCVKVAREIEERKQVSSADSDAMDVV